MSTYLLWERHLPFDVIPNKGLHNSNGPMASSKDGVLLEHSFSPIFLPSSLSPTNIYQGINVFQEQCQVLGAQQ